MNTQFQAVLAEYHTRMHAESKLFETLGFQEAIRRRDEMLLPVGPDTGALLSALVRGSHAQLILEIGMSYGYSTLWLADAARHTGGRVISLEISPSKVEYAREMLAKTSLEQYVDCIIGDALTTLTTLSGPFDLVLLDLWKDLYIPCFDRFHSNVKAGGIIVADNMLHPDTWRETANAYRDHVRQTNQFDSVLLPVGSGLEVSRKK